MAGYGTSYGTGLSINLKTVVNRPVPDTRPEQPEYSSTTNTSTNTNSITSTSAIPASTVPNID